MDRPSQKPILTKEEEAVLRKRSRSLTEGYRDVVRAKMVLMSADGVSDAEIARDLSLSPTTVRTWRSRFLSDRIEGLNDRPRSVRPDKEKVSYGRNGISNLFSSYDTVTGEVFDRYKPRKRRMEFLEFLDEVVAQYPADKQIHIIMDNYPVHKNCDEWLWAHPNVTFHYTPSSASWLNLVEVYFGILARKVLRGGSFRSVEELVKAMMDFSDEYNENAKPFVWRKAEVKGSQLRNTIRNPRDFTPRG